MRCKTRYFLLCLLLLASCGKDQPSAPQPVTNPAQGMDYYKKFSVHYAPGTYGTGGKAQYGQTQPQGISGQNGGQSKLDLFLFDDDTTYLLEYWEVATGTLYGAAVTGRWYVDESGKLVLLDGNQKVAVGSPEAVGANGGIRLQFDASFNPHAKSPQTLATQLKDSYLVTYSSGATPRLLPPNLKENLPRQMGQSNSRGDQHNFKD